MHLTRALAVVAAAAALIAVAPTALAPAAPRASAAKSCDVGNSRSYGTTYVLSIGVSHTSCRSAKRLIRAYHACRPGKSGHCGSVKGYRCSESRFNKGRTSYDSRVTCRKGSRTVKHTYTQFI
jgi:hypothetical protein